VRGISHCQLKFRANKPDISQEHRDQPNSLVPLFFRIKIETMTGHRANPDFCEAAIKTPTASSVERQREVRERQWTQILKSALVYFVIVFGTGSVLGPIRTLLALMPLMVGRNVIGSVQKRKAQHHAESDSSHGFWPEDAPGKINAQH
jgi:hypothetical protein